jgi:uncharacterized protein YebE (UPF0316 family)
MTKSCIIDVFLLFLLKNYFYMTTVTITLENKKMIPALQNVLSHLKGVKNVMVWENDESLPNKKTMAAMRELQQGKGVRCKNVQELFEQLNS